MYRGRLDGDPQHVATLRGRTLGFAVDGDGNAYCADPDGPGLYRITPAGEVAEISSGSSDRSAVYPNHPALLATGEILWTDSRDVGAPRRLHLHDGPDGSTAVVDRTACRFPNGLAVSPDGKTLAVVETQGLPGVAALAIDGTTLSGYRVLVELPDTVPDGVAFDVDGGLLISMLGHPTQSSCSARAEPLKRWCTIRSGSSWISRPTSPSARHAEGGRGKFRRAVPQRVRARPRRRSGSSPDDLDPPTPAPPTD